MSETEPAKPNLSEIKRNRSLKVFDPAISSFFVQLPQKIQHSLQAQLKRFAENDRREAFDRSTPRKEEGSPSSWEINLEKQMQAWKQNPSWVDQPSQIKVSVPKGSLCNLSVDFNVGLPPDAVYNIVTDPDNRRVFKNIKEVISREVLVDEGQRQVVELEQAALWKFLWWSGVISVHVLVDQNREDHSMKFKQVKTGFMKKFEGCWKVQPLFVDEKSCHPFKPKSWEDYYSCTGGKGRIGSKVSLEQLIQPALVPPPPISWYLRGITAKTTEMLIHDLLAEAARIRQGNAIQTSRQTALSDEQEANEICDIKERRALHRRTARRRQDTVQTNRVIDISDSISEELEANKMHNIKERWALHRRNARQRRRLWPTKAN